MPNMENHSKDSILIDSSKVATEDNATASRNRKTKVKSKSTKRSRECNTERVLQTDSGCNERSQCSKNLQETCGSTAGLKSIFNVDCKQDKHVEHGISETCVSDLPLKLCKTRQRNNSFETKRKSSKLKLSKKSKEHLNLTAKSHNDVEDKRIVETDTTKLTRTSMDAFQVMMEARKKSIGMNSPGKELPPDNDQKDLSSQRELKAKRLLSLSAWADKKGAGKRREMEKLQDKHIQNALSKRAKNFKEMLQKSNKEIKAPLSPTTKLKKNVEEFESIFKCSVSNQKRIRDNKGEKVRKRIKLQSCENSEKNKSTDEPCVSVKVIKPASSRGQDDFLEKLNPSLKKRESMLSYFGKLEESQENNSIIDVEDLDSKSAEEDLSNVLKVKFKSHVIKKSTLKLKKTKLKKKQNGSIPSVDQVLQETPQDAKVNNSMDNEIKRQRQKKEKQSCVDKKVNMINSSNNEESQRPKRTIKKPVKYIQESSESSDSDSDDNKFNIFSPIKKKKDKINGKLCNSREKKKISKNTDKENIITIEIEDKVSPIKIINLQSPGSLKCTRSPRINRKDDLMSAENLAPLFKKNLPKPKVEASVLEARKMFLQSGVPDSIKKHFDKPLTISSDCVEFHSVCHVQQIPSTLDYVNNLPLTVLEVSNSSDSLHTQIKGFDFKPFICVADTSNEYSRFNQMYQELQNYNVADGLKKIKSLFPNFPVYKSFKGLWEKFSNKSKFHKNVVNTNLQYDESVDGLSNLGFDLWTEKYKPSTSLDILGNSKSVTCIKRWLESWKEYNELAAVRVSRRPRRDSGSSCDFNTSDSESRDSWRTPNNVMVVTGPPGSGKTSCIYVVANELGINVLEVNASSKRTGKKILSELHEATQSHKVLTKMSSESSVNDSVNCSDKNEPQNDKSKKSKTNALFEPKLKKNTVNNKHKKVLQNDSQGSSNAESCSQKSSEINIMSLMLIDDADVVFDEDDGFVGALSQLVQSSKRPVVIVASDVNCNHLQRFITENNLVSFRPLSGKILGPWLDIILLIESNKIFPKLSTALIELYQGDMRSSILQIQYWIQGLKNVSESSQQTLSGDKNDECNNLPQDIKEEMSNEDTSLSQKECSNIIECNINDISLSSNCVIKKDEQLNLEYVVQRSLLLGLLQTCDLGRCWWNTFSILQVEENNENDSIENLTDGTLKSNSDFTNNKIKSSDLESISNLFDCLSSVDMMESCSRCNSDAPDPAKPLRYKELKDSISEVENESMFKSHGNVSTLWCQYMMEYYLKCIKDVGSKEYDDMAFVDSLDVRLQEKKKSMFCQLSEAIYSGSKLDKSGTALDYMATLRSMCRSEKIRSENNFKRNNRFHNYLHTLNITAKDNILSQVSNIFQSKPS